MSNTTSKTIDPHQPILTVPTPAGNILVYPPYDKQVPAVFVMFRPNGRDEEIDLVTIECKQNSDDIYGIDNDHIYMTIFGNAFSEDYTDIVKINKNDVIASLSDSDDKEET